jgi:hypothetical protein
MQAYQLQAQASSLVNGSQIAPSNMGFGFGSGIGSPGFTGVVNQLGLPSFGMESMGGSLGGFPSMNMPQLFPPIMPPVRMPAQSGGFPSLSMLMELLPVLLELSEQAKVQENEASSDSDDVTADETASETDSSDSESTTGTTTSGSSSTHPLADVDQTQGKNAGTQWEGDRKAKPDADINYSSGNTSTEGLIANALGFQLTSRGLGDDGYLQAYLYPEVDKSIGFTKRLDVDKNGQTSVDEYMAAMVAMDKDKNGIVTKAERTAFWTQSVKLTNQQIEAVRKQYQDMLTKEA